MAVVTYLIDGIDPVLFLLEDGYGFEIKLYPEVFSILEKAKKEGIKMGTVSRTLEPEYGKQLLKLLDLEKYFISCEFDTGKKPKSPN